MFRMKKWLTCLLPALWYGLIYYFSAQTATVSSGQSGHLLHGLLGVFCRSYRGADRVVQETVNELLQFYVRKGAHMTLYLVLCLLILLAIWRVTGRMRRTFLAPVISLALAALDEYHQTFVPGRSGELRDVMVDLCGALIGLLLVWLVRAAMRGSPAWLPPVLLFLAVAVAAGVLVFPDAIRWPLFTGDTGEDYITALIPFTGSQREIYLSAASTVLHDVMLRCALAYGVVAVIYSLIFRKQQKSAKKEAIH